MSVLASHMPMSALQFAAAGSVVSASPCVCVCLSAPRLCVSVVITWQAMDTYFGSRFIHAPTNKDNRHLRVGQCDHEHNKNVRW